MLPDLQQLLVIQDRDQRIKELNADLERLPLEEDNAKLRLSDDTKAVADAKVTIQENDVAIKALELDIETRRDSIAKLKVQQFETRKNEEYQALGTEVERYQGEIDGLETSELELMEKADELKAALAEAEAGLARTQEVVNTELGDIDERRKVCAAQLSETEEDRKKLGEAIDADLLDEFERIFKSKRDRAIAPLENGVCQGCHMKVTPATAVDVRAEKSIAHCDQCGLMLYNGDI